MADTLSYTTEKALKEHGDKLSPEEVKAIQDKMEDVKSANSGEDIEKIKKASDDLATAAQKIGEIMYKAAQEAESQKTQKGAESQSTQNGAENAESKTKEGSPAEAASAKEGEVVEEAEYKEKKD